MNQRLGVIHKAVAERSHLSVEGLVLIEELPDKFLVPRRHDVLVPGVHGLGAVRLRQHQILRDVAQLRIREELDLLFLLLPVHDKVRGRQHGFCQERSEILAQVVIDPVRRQLLAEILIGGDVLHGQRRHGLVIMIDLRDKVRRQTGLQLQRLRLNLVAVEVQRAAGGAQELVCLLDDDGAAILAGTHLKDIVDIAIADLNAVRLLIGLEKMEHFHGVPLHILRFHQKKAAVIRHKVLPFCQLVRLNVFVEFCSKLLYNPQISAK